MGNYITIQNKTGVKAKLEAAYNKHLLINKAQFNNDFGTTNSFEDVFEIQSENQKDFNFKTGVLDKDFYSAEFMQDVQKILLGTSIEIVHDTTDEKHNEEDDKVHEQRCNAIAEVREYASETDPIRFLDSPIPKNHLYCVRGKYCDYYQTTNMINVYVKYDLKKLNLETDLPYLARLSKSYDEFVEYWDKEADKLKRMVSDVFYKFKNDCQRILDAMNAIDKQYFFNFHTND